VLFTTHNLEHALDYADRVLVLANGNIVLNECAAELSVDMLTERFHLSDEPREIESSLHHTANKTQASIPAAMN
jgi:ABC-type multidrug transport system ATPase subunit